MSSSETYKKKLVFVTSRFPYPLEKGDKLRAYHQIQELSKYYEVHLIALHENKLNKESTDELEKYCKTVNAYQLPSLIKWLITFLFLFGNKPLQVGYFYNPWIKRKVEKLLKALEPDFIYCQLIRASTYVKDYHDCPKALDYMDALSKGVERRIKDAKGIKKWILQTECARLKTYENIIFEYFELHSVISEEDRKFILHPENKKIKVVPNGVDERFFKAQKNTKEIDVLFTGNMSYPPNIKAAKFIAEKLAPSLPDNNFYIVGANPVKEVKKLANTNVIVTGWVEEITDYYAKSRVFLAPMKIGTGLQNKLLEAMACGVPCITSSLANKALKAKPNKEVIIADEDESIIVEIKNLLLNNTFSEEIAKNGQDFIRKNYNWENTTKLLVKSIEEQ